jgi:imidazolonepropionase-like amidohydrolase
MNKLLALVFLFALTPPAFGWNEKGHLVTARLAWRQLTEAQRARVTALLKKHPHYEEFLLARKAEGFSEDEWAFLRAATWADWVRSHHREQFDRPTWHYINHPIVPAGSAVDPAQHEPPAKQENVVNQLAVCVEKVRTGTEQEQAVYFTWLFHLVGDIHQPLHCTAVYSERFPDGDRGGNLAFIRVGSRPTNLHAFWDGLLGTGTTTGDIGKDVLEIEKVMEEKADDIKKELAAHQSFESWGREGLELSRRVVYLNGGLKVAAGRDDDAPEAPGGYAASACRTARVQIGKAGARLADQLKRLFPQGGTAAGASPAQPPPPAPVLIKNVRVFDGRSETLADGMHLLVVGNKIAKVSREPLPPPGSALVIDGGGRVLTPGLIDTHVHLLGGVSREAMQTGDLVYAAQIGNREARRVLLRGFTAVRDTGGNVFGLKRAIDEGVTDGPRVYPSGAALSQTAGHADFRPYAEPHRLRGGPPSLQERFGNVALADGVPEVLALTREQLRRGASQVKLMAGGGAYSDYDPLDVKQFTAEEMRAAVQAAADWNTYVTVHVYNAEGIRRAIAAGVRCIEHGHLADEETLKLMAEKGVPLSTQVVPFVSTQELPGLTEVNRRKFRQVQEATDLLMRLARKHKVLVTFSTDLVGTPENQAQQPREFGERAKWFLPVEILRQATSDAALVLALSGPRNPYPGKLGVIEEGAYADLLIVEGNPLENIRLLEEPEKNLALIMKDGKVYKNTLK